MSRDIKPEIRIIGWDDAPFTFRDKETLLVGTIYRGGAWMDGVVTTKIRVDGRDSTSKIVEAVKSSPHYRQLRVIMLNGITFGGFNIADIKAINKETGLPVLALIREKPDLEKMKKALKKFKDHEKRLRIIKKAGSIKTLKVSYKDKKGMVMKSIWFQAAGTDSETAGKIIRMACTRSLTPEPLRSAHLIASSLRN